MWTHTVSLTAHPSHSHADGSVSPVSELTATVTLGVSSDLSVDFVLRGEIPRLRFAPAVASPQRRATLWQHTCFEVFVKTALDSQYLEFNFSPSGDWAAYQFLGYRTGRCDFDPSRISSRMTGTGADRCCLQAKTHLPNESAPLLLNVAAVIETLDGVKSYWASCHTRAAPDFHDPAAFCLFMDA